MRRLSVVPGEPDDVARLERFRARHPEIAVITSTGTPTALVGREEVRRPSVGMLLDRLEEMTGDGPAAPALGKPNNCHYPACWIKPPGSNGYCDEGRNCVN